MHNEITENTCKAAEKTDKSLNDAENFQSALVAGTLKKLNRNKEGSHKFF